MWGSGAENDEVSGALLACSETGLIALDGERLVARINLAALDLLGLADQQNLGPMDDLARASSTLTTAAVARLGDWLAADRDGELLLSRADGRTMAVRSSAGPGEHRLLAISLERRATVPALRRDPLTGLPDRAWFFERLGHMLAEPNCRPAVLMIDLDRFKAINDARGHAVGDALLQVVAKRLSHTLRETDIVSRIAGDEFAVASSRASDPEAFGRRLVTVLSRPYLIEGATATIGASVGVALGPEHGNDPHALLRSADLALYAAKQSGRGETRLFDLDLDRTARERQTMVEALRRAVSLKQLELHFQPQIAIGDGRLTGFEALVRWRHPEFGLLYPDRFIPLAEEAGLIWLIGDWVLRTACEAAIGWPSPLSVSINISPKQLLDRNRLARTVRRVLLKTGLAPNRLELEITESALMHEAETLPVLLAVRETGVRISLDDFGTGCSSLSQLRRFPLDRLKIDQSFVHALGSSSEAEDVVRAIASLGRSLGIVTIAEGVETADQQRHLQLDGCTEMQGFFLSHPVPASEIGPLIQLLSERRPGPALVA